MRIQIRTEQMRKVDSHFGTFQYKPIHTPSITRSNLGIDSENWSKMRTVLELCNISVRPGTYCRCCNFEPIHWTLLEQPRCEVDQLDNCYFWILRNQKVADLLERRTEHVECTVIEGLCYFVERVLACKSTLVSNPQWHTKMEEEDENCRSFSDMGLHNLKTLRWHLCKLNFDRCLVVVSMLVEDLQKISALSV